MPESTKHMACVGLMDGGSGLLTHFYLNPADRKKEME